jgi:hypothetical protein
VTKLWSRGTAFALAFSAGSAIAEAASDGGGIVGYVEDGRGTPVSGAVISLFGRGLAGAGLVTLSDSTGRFVLNSLPAGSYTVRALAEKHRPATARRVTILPNQDATFTISLAAEAEARAEGREAAASAEKSDSETAARELRWLLRHKRRSALEERSQGPEEPQASAAMAAGPGVLAALANDLAASVELMTTPDTMPGVDGEGMDHLSGNLGMVRLQGRIADSVHWALGGLVAERDGTTWRMAGDFVFTPFGDHEIQASTGYGSVAPRTAPFAGMTERWQDRGVGAIEVKDRWQVAEKIAATLGGRYTYVGFMPSANHLDPSATVELQRDERTRFRGSVSRRTLVPGGDVLTLSGMSSTSAVALAVMDEGLRPERVMRYEIALGQDLGPVSLEARTFYEGVRDQLVQRFEPAGGVVHVRNGGRVSARGMGVSVARRFGDVVHGQVSYTFGHAWRPGATVVEGLAWRESDFHDLSARLETVIEETDTRVIALWRVNRLTADPTYRVDVTPVNNTNTRFDVQLSQGLPFLGTLTRADWDVLVAVKNVYYGDAEGGVLDEIAVVNPPKRVLGGISVRF